MTTTLDLTNLHRGDEIRTHINGETFPQWYKVAGVSHKYRRVKVHYRCKVVVNNRTIIFRDIETVPFANIGEFRKAPRR